MSEKDKPKFKFREINTRTFAGYVVLILYAFYTQEDPTKFLVTIVGTAVLLMIGVDKPSISKLLLEMAKILADVNMPAEVKLAKINALWPHFAMIWTDLSAAVAYEEKLKKSKKKNKKIIDPLKTQKEGE